MEILSNKGSTKSDYVQFGPFYQTYLYAFFIGFNKGERLPLTGASDQFREFGLWQPKSMVDFILMLLFTNLDELKDWNALEELDESKLDEKVKIIHTAIEEYSNAGLSYIQDKFDNEHIEFQDEFVFINLLNELINNNK
jgi:hypothetical protein